MIRFLLIILIINFTFQQNAICVMFPTDIKPSVSGVLYLEYDTILNQTNITGTLSGFNPNKIHGLHVHTLGVFNHSKYNNNINNGHYNPFNSTRII
jgi:Cu/Zn superoxide dismutase